VIIFCIDFSEREVPYDFQGDSYFQRHAYQHHDVTCDHLGCSDVMVNSQVPSNVSYFYRNSTNPSGAEPEQTSPPQAVYNSYSQYPVGQQSTGYHVTPWWSSSSEESTVEFDCEPKIRRANDGRQSVITQGKSTQCR